MRRALLLTLCLLSSAAEARSSNALGPPPDAPPGGYRVWYDHDGWHVRGVAGDMPRRFHGTLTVQGGAADLKPVPSGLQAKLLSRLNALIFDFRTAGEAGFDFSADAECVVLELKVDERHAPRLVRIGARGDTPPLFPYEACR